METEKACGVYASEPDVVIFRSHFEDGPYNTEPVAKAFYLFESEGRTIHAESMNETHAFIGLDRIEIIGFPEPKKYVWAWSRIVWCDVENKGKDLCGYDLAERSWRMGNSGQDCATAA